MLVDEPCEKVEYCDLRPFDSVISCQTTVMGTDAADPADPHLIGMAFMAATCVDHKSKKKKARNTYLVSLAVQETTVVVKDSKVDVKAMPSEVAKMAEDSGAAQDTESEHQTRNGSKASCTSLA